MANKFVPWIDKVEPGTTTQEQSVFAEDSQRVNGFVAGDPASAIRVNSALRQANVVVAALMQLADELETLPDLDLNSSVANIANALKASIITPIETHLSNLDDKVEQELSKKQDALTSQQIVNINNVPNKLDKNLGTGLAGQFLVVGDNGDIITTDTIDGGGGGGGSGGGNIGSYWTVIPNASIPTHYGDAYISFNFTTNNGYDENLIGAKLKDILLASSVNIYKTQTDYAYQEMDMSELCSTIYNGDGTADGKQIIKGKATIDNGGMKDYDCLLFVYESGTDVYLTIGLVAEDKNAVYMTREVRLDESESFPTAGFFIGNS